MQLIIISRISREENLWIWGINNSVDDEAAEKLVSEYRKNKNSKHYESVMDIIIRANERTFKGEKKMCKAMEEIMEDRIVEREQKAREEARAEARAEEKKEDILECLKRYGEISERLKRRIFAESDLAVLKHWFQVALNVRTIEEFQNAI